MPLVIASMLPEDLLRPDAWPHPRPVRVDLVETHVSWVLFGDREVLKIKKPVALGFLDFRSLERRRVACQNEVRLNTRLAPGVYLGVVPIVRSGARLSVGGPGEVADWAVHMRRLDDDGRADSMLERGSLTYDQLDAVARALADFHRAAPVSEAIALRWASPSALEANVRENFGQTAGLAREYLDEREADDVERAQLAFVAEHQALLFKRIETGRVRDGHGDLRLEHVYLHHEGLRIIDCIEFDERYRIGDVCSDIAFLSMDLAGHGQVASSEWFLARYAQHSGDYDLYALVDFYESYRAWVRAKVSAILACDPGASEDVHRRAALEARRHFMLARACMRPPLAPPLLVCVGGVIGSGKSTVAEKLSAALSCAVVDSDRTRKQILAIAETQAQNDPAWTGAYSPGTTARVYGEALRRASVVLASHRPVIVDASFRSSSMRHRAREIARSRGAGFVFVECRAPVDVCRARLTSRSRGPSDGRPALLEEFVASFEPMTELASSEHVVVDTTQPVERTIDALRARLSDAS